MSQKIKYILLFIVSMPFVVYGQGGSLDGGEIKVEKEIGLEVSTAVKEFAKMDKVVKKEEKADLNYELKLLKYELPSLNPSITPAQLHHDNIESLYGNYVKAGFGNYTTPYLDAFFNAMRSDELDYGVHIRHLSSQEGDVLKELSGSSHNEVEVFGSYFMGNNKLSAKLAYDRRGLAYYGYEPVGDEVLERDSIKQIYNLVDFSVDYQLNPEGKDLSIRPYLDFYYFSDNYDAIEYGVTVGGKGAYAIDDEKSIDVDLNAFINQTEQDTVTFSRHLFSLSPSLKGKLDQLTYEVGFRFVYSTDTNALDKNTYIYPNVNAYYEIDKGVLGAFAKIEGGLDRMNLRSVTEQNPFTGQAIDLVHQNTMVDATLGVEFVPMSESIVRLGIGYGLIGNMGFFINNPDDVSRFALVYDSANVGHFHATLEASTKIKDVRASLSTTFNSYGVSDTMQEAWHKPSIVNKLDVSYNHRDKWNFDLGVYHYGGIKALTIDEESNLVTNNLDAVFDISLGVDYYINEQLGAFLKLQNIANQNYQMYNRYEVRGIQFLIGASYSF